MIQIITRDGQIFNLSNDEISFSNLLCQMTQDLTVVTKIPIFQFPSFTIEKICQYLKLFAHPPISVNLQNQTDSSWITTFLEENVEYLDSLLEASIFLEISSLTDIISSLIADEIIKCKTIETIKSKFQITSDFSPEMERSLQEKISWALK